MLESYTQSFKNLYNQMPTWMMCESMGMCKKNKSVAVNQLHNPNCLKGKKFWCSSWDNAKECKVIRFTFLTVLNLNIIILLLTSLNQTFDY